MEEKIIFYKMTILAFLAFVLEQFGTFGILWIILLFMFVADFITGTSASGVEKANKVPDSGLESKKGAIGIFKKVAYVMAICLGMAVDLLVYVLTDFFDITLPLPTKMFFGTLVCLWFILNEMLSVIENIERIGVDMPLWLTAFVTLLKNKVDKKAEDEIEAIK